MKDFLTIVFKYKFRIFVLFVIILSTVTLFTYVYPFSYEASAKILVKFARNDISLLSASNTSKSTIIMRNSQEEILSEIEILNNRFLMEKVVKLLWEDLTAVSIETPTTLWQKTKVFFKTIFKRLKNTLLDIAYKLDLIQRVDPFQGMLRAVQGNFKISAVQRSNVINVKYRSWNPVLCAKVVNALTDFYLDHHIEVHKVPRAHSFFEKQKNLSEIKLKKQEEKLKEFKQKWNLSSIEAERKFLLENLSKLMLEDKNISSSFQTNKLKQYQSRIRTLGEKEMALHRMELNLKIIENSYKRYLSQLEEIRISEALDLANISNVTVIEPALVPISPVRKISFIPRRILHIFFGIIMGLIAGLCYAFLVDYFDHTFKSSHEIDKLLNTTCFASIPDE